MNNANPILSATALTALFLIGGAGAAAQDPAPVHYTCADGTTVRAKFSGPDTSLGSVTLLYGGASAETTLPQALSADGGRYTKGDVEFWIKGNGATLTRAGRSTSCRTGPS